MTQSTKKIIILHPLVIKLSINIKIALYDCDFNTSCVLSTSNCVLCLGTMQSACIRRPYKTALGIKTIVFIILRGFSLLTHCMLLSLIKAVSYLTWLIKPHFSVYEWLYEDKMISRFVFSVKSLSGKVSPDCCVFMSRLFWCVELCRQDFQHFPDYSLMVCE